MTKIIAALDFQTKSELTEFLKETHQELQWVKIGMELFYSLGADAISIVKEYQLKVFLDLKIHDIPNTAMGATKSLSRLGVDMLNFHLSGGEQMLKSVQNLTQDWQKRPLLIGVSVLTSMNQLDLKSIGINSDIQLQVQNLAAMAQRCKLDGIVCSALEVKDLKMMFPNLKYVTPGIRIVQNQDDQSRVCTPRAAKEMGSDFLVIGRPITQSNDPLTTIKSIKQELEAPHE